MVYSSNLNRERTGEVRRPSKIAIVSGVLLACFACLRAETRANAAIRVVGYNMYNNPDNAAEDAWIETIFSAIGAETVDGLAKRPDVVAVSETDTGSSARLVSVLNNVYGVSTYSVLISSSDGGSDRTGVLYDSSTLALLGWADLTDIGTHTITRAHFRPAGETGGDSEFYVYAIHLKSGSTSSAKSARAAEAANLRADADALGQGAHIIYAGDFNMYGSSEGAWVNMTAAGSGQAFDTADAPGQWRDNEDFKRLHSQDSRSQMDDRFDLQFVTGELLDGQGLDYIADSYRVFGNDGTHTLNAAISTGSGASGDILAALELASDHLPIVADYEFIIPEPDTPGDTDGDHDVDVIDYGNMVAQLGGAPGVKSADFNGDNFVDLEDFAILRGNFGFGVESAPDAEFGAITPEPTTLGMLALGGLVVLRRRRTG